MNRHHKYGLAFLVLMLVAVIYRECRRPPAAVPPLTPPKLDLFPVERKAPPPEPLPRAVTPGKAERSPERLADFLQKLGRARLLRDRRSLAILMKEAPPIFEGDLEWIVSRLQGELLAAAGAAEIVRALRHQRAVAELGEIISHPAHPILKEIAIETLAALASDGAATVLLGALRNDPDEGVRSRAAAALGGFHGPEAYHALAAALRDPSAQVRSFAAGALGKLPSREAVDLLLGAMLAERDPRIQADFAIGAWSAGGEASRLEVLRHIVATGARGVILDRQKARDGSRYHPAYDAAFFRLGQPPVPLTPATRRIGITVETGPGVTLAEVGTSIFGTPPFDRYREWFRFRRAEEFPALRAYDTYGNPTGEIAYDDRDGTVFLRFRDPHSFEKGVLGYTKGCEAFVTGISLLHEFGHAFAALADEYSEGSSDDAANLARKSPVSWDPLVRTNLLTQPVRRDATFVVPSDDCHMANRPGPTRFCPVCQLEIHARIADLAGSPLPW